MSYGLCNVTVNAIMDLIFPSSRKSLTSALAVMANDLVPLLIGSKNVAKTQIAETMQKGIDACLRVPYKGVVEKLGHVLSVMGLEPFLMSLSNRFFPNETCARNFLQLFIICVIQLQPDGSPVHVDGKEVTHFARLFTGFARHNVEYFHESRIDPLVVYLGLHDMCPKVDLDRKSMGDGFHLCDDVGLFPVDEQRPLPR